MFPNSISPQGPNTSANIARKPKSFLLFQAYFYSYPLNHLGREPTQSQVANRRGRVDSERERWNEKRNSDFCIVLIRYRCWWDLFSKQWGKALNSHQKSEGTWMLYSLLSMTKFKKREFIEAPFCYCARFSNASMHATLHFDPLFPLTTLILLLWFRESTILVMETFLFTPSHAQCPHSHTLSFMENRRFIVVSKTRLAIWA